MPLLNETLSLWEIAHRWNNHDPDKFRLAGVPLEVKDSIRLMMHAILSLSLVAFNIITAKRPRDSDIPREFFIRTHVDDFYACIDHGRCNKKLLKFIVIEQLQFQNWCERCKIPLPEFWFPKGWEHGDLASSIIGIPTTTKTSDKSASEVAQKAAQVRHEPLNKLKQEFCKYWLQGSFKSRADAARRFLKSLPPESGKLLVESNAVRTLTQALARHLGPKGKE